MADWIKYLSGHVPGGVGLYLLLMIVIFVTLWQISRSSELFTRKHFIRTYAIIWVVLTAAYAHFWFKSPPPQALYRYSTFFYSEDSSSRWMATYLRDELEAHLAPHRSYTDYFFKERWRYLGGLDVLTPDDGRLQNMIASIPIDEILIGKVSEGQGRYRLSLQLRRGERVVDQAEFNFRPGDADWRWQDLLKWIEPYFPLADNREKAKPASIETALIRDNFFRGRYAKSLEACREQISEYGADSQEYRFAEKWAAYNQIRLAVSLRQDGLKKARNPYDKKKSEWQKKLAAARAVLIPVAKAHINTGVEDALLNRMIGESFILEGFYNDAADFLKMAYTIDPEDIETLENLSYLHPSRYKELSFPDEESILRRIIALCPLYEKAVTKYAELKLTNAPVKDAPAREAKQAVEHLLRINPQSVNGLILQGKYYTSVFDYKQAIGLFEQADSLQPNLPVVHYNLGVAYYKQKQIASAEHHFKKAIQLGDYLDAHLYLGAIYKERGQFEEALAEFRYRVAHKIGDDDYYAVQAMKGIRECLDSLNIEIPK